MANKKYADINSLSRFKTKLEAEMPSNTTYSLSKSGSTITLTGSDGTASSVNDDSSGIPVLSSEEYIFELNDGIYKLPSYCKLYYNSQQHFTTPSTGYLIVTSNNSYKLFYAFTGTTTNLNYLYIGTSSENSGSYSKVVTEDTLNNRLSNAIFYDVVEDI